jgi:hypothetical protein
MGEQLILKTEQEAKGLEPVLLVIRDGMRNCAPASTLRKKYDHVEVD